MLHYNSGGIWVNEHRHRGKSTETELNRRARETETAEHTKRMRT